jgi:hypothetical protein
MDANSFLKRVTLIALVSALPTFVSVASSGGGGHSSGGSSGGSSSGGSSGGHSSSGSNSGHSSSASNSGHSSGATNSGHSATGSKGGHSAGDPSTGPASIAGGHPVAGTHISLSSVHKVSVAVSNPRIFSSGGASGRGNWEADDDRPLHHRRLLFGFLPF